jgi:high-affinity iron transporter
MTLLASSLLSNIAYGSTDYTDFAFNVERIKAHLTLVQSADSKAFAHASIVGKLASQIELVREKDKALADSLYLNLIDLPALVKANTNVGSHISDGQIMLDKALITVIPNEVRNDHSFNAQIIFMLLTAADQEYGNDSQTAIAYVKRAQTIYNEKLGSGNVDFTDIIEKMEKRADFNTVTSTISKPQREMLALFSTVDEHSKYFGKIRELLPQLIEEYKNGNYARSDELAIEAYLDNFEYLEPPIAKHDKQLMEEIEIMMRVELREMIREEAPAEDIESHVNDIFAKLEEAERLLGPSSFAIDAVFTNGHDNLASAMMAEPMPDTQPMGSAEDTAKKEVMNQVDVIRSKLIASLDDYQNGRYDSAFENARSAYLDSYEYIEIPLTPIDPNFTLEMEIKFSELRNLIQDRAPYEEVQAKVVEIRKGLDESERLVTGTGVVAPAIAFSSSFSIIFREGLESALIIGAIVTYLEASRNERFKKNVYYGIILAIAATAITWFVASFLFTISGMNRELIEAVAALSATGVLFYVSFWILNKIETKKWIEFVKAKVWQATTTGSIMVFVLLSFFTVYREGFETVLFYQAMFSFAKYMENFVALGLILGLASLLVIYYAIRRLGRKLPLKVLFALTMGVGAYLSIAFIGNGVRELQEAGYIKTTHMLGIIPRLDINLAVMTGIHPTLETVIAQIALLSIYIVGMLYVLVWRSRREQAIAQARKSRADIDAV